MSCSPVVQRASVLALVLPLLTGACATASTTTTGSTTATPGSRPQTSTPGATEQDADPTRWLAEAEASLAREQPARAATLFARYLARAEIGSDLDTARAYLGLAEAHEQLGDFEAAIRAYDGWIAKMSGDADAYRVFARRGACEAEIGAWERSASSYARVLEVGGETLIPSQRVEALARRGYALFQLDRHDEADAVFAQADEIFEQATSEGEERFSDTYFVGLARFYRAAIIHLEFRAVPIRLPEAQMAKDFERKLEVLERAQDAYNEVIRAKHIFWVSAAGYQLGSLFEEFYDAVMHAPVPDWLDEQQRRTYYAELEEQLRPVIDKAIWVFEKNLETARKFGYESEFIERTEAQLAQLQAILLGRGDPGEPVPRLAPHDARGDHDPNTEMAVEQLPGVERKLFVPIPTTL